MNRIAAVLEAWEDCEDIVGPTVDPVCYLYVIKERDADRPLKIGITAYPTKRLGELNIGNYRPLEIAWLFRCPDRRTASLLETDLHLLFEPKAVQGEWFDIAWPEIRQDLGNYVKARMNLLRVCECGQEAGRVAGHIRGMSLSRALAKLSQ